MSNRHLARTIALQVLYWWDFRALPEKELNNVLDYNMREFAPEFDDNGFTRALVKGVMKHFDEINELIVTYAPEWPLDKIAKIDRAILEIGVYEIVFSRGEVPPVVAINEAVEIAKHFGDENSPRFVNGVLSTVMKKHYEK